MIAQRSNPLSEIEEDRLPVLLRAADAPGLAGRALYLGNQVAANDADLLLENGVTSSLNIAINIDIPPLTLKDGTVVRRTHIGLIDGPGNVPHHLLAALFALHGMLHQASPGKAHYPAHRAGNVLVHCRGGRSRSATVLALYLYLATPAMFPTFDDAIDHIRDIRNLGHDQPQASMLALASEAVAILRMTGTREMFGA